MVNNYKIMFLRSKNNHPVGCLAINLNFESKILQPVEYQVSTLNPTDPFNRKMARQLAVGRLTESPIVVQDVDCSNIHSVVRAVMNHIAKGTTLPKRSRNAAKNWLLTKGR